VEQQVKPLSSFIRQELVLTHRHFSDTRPRRAVLPEDCDRILLDALQEGDIETSVALYEPDATLFSKSGEVMMGHDAIRANNAALIALKPTFHVEYIVSTMNGDGSIATTRMKARLEGTRPDGRPVRSALHTLEVLRRQGDGSWRYVIDDPFGSMRAQLEPGSDKA
jgi:uncharacterized protein (TIGR02246 family)